MAVNPCYITKDPNEIELCRLGQGETVEPTNAFIDAKHNLGVVVAKDPKDVPAIKEALAKIDAARKSHEEAYARYSEFCLKGDMKACGTVKRMDFSDQHLYPPTNIAKTLGEQKIPLKMNAIDYIIVEDSDESKRWEYIFDTGASYTIMAQSFVDSHPESFQLSGERLLDALDVYNVNGVQIGFGNTRYDIERVPSSALFDNIGNVEEEHKIVALVGMDYIRDQSFEVDFDNRTLTLNPNLMERMIEGGWQVAPLHPVNFNLFTVDVTVNGKQMQFMLDTGSSHTTILRRCSDKQLLKDATVLVTNTGVLGEMKEQNAGHQRFEVGGIKFDDQALTVSGDSKMYSNFSPDGICGLLGMDVLSKFRFIVDFVSMSVFLKRRKDYKGFNIGINFQAIAGAKEWEITSIDKDGRGAKAGLSVGDKVVEINDIPVEKITLYMVGQFYYGRSIKLKVVTKDGEGEVEFVKMPKIK